VQDDLPLGRGRVVLAALGPIVADGVSQSHAIGGEGEGGDGGGGLGERAYAVALAYVPDGVSAVGPGCGEYVLMCGRVGHGVDGVDVRVAFLGGVRLTVALELQVVEAEDGDGVSLSAVWGYWGKVKEM